MLNIFAGLPVRASFTQKQEGDGRAYREKLGPIQNTVRLSLVHGDDIAVIKRGPAGLYAEGRIFDFDEGYLDVYDVDGAVTREKDVFLTTTHGDCIPIWIADKAGDAVGVAHAGWRGTLKGAAGSLARAMVKDLACRPEDLCAYIGPGIGACCFEVGWEVAESFTDKYPWAEEFVFWKGHGKPYIDLKGINAQLLEFEGVEDIDISKDCTCCAPDLYWSYRRCEDKARMLAFIAGGCNGRQTK